MTEETDLHTPPMDALTPPLSSDPRWVEVTKDAFYAAVALAEARVSPAPLLAVTNHPGWRRTTAVNWEKGTQWFVGVVDTWAPTGTEFYYIRAKPVGR